MAKKVLSIVIGTERTRVCELSYKKNYKNKGIRIYRSISFATPINTIEDGYIKDMSVFGEELKIQLRAAKLKTDKVIFSVNSSKIANREVIIPPVKEKRIMDIIRTGAGEYFPIDMKDYILSYLILEKKSSLRKDKTLQKKLEKREAKLAKRLEKQNKKILKKKSKTELIADKLELLVGETKENDVSPETKQIQTDSKNIVKKQFRLSVFAAPSTLIKNYYSFAKQMHFDIVAIDYSGNSSYQLYRRHVNKGTTVLVQMNEMDTLITILKDGVLILQRTVSYGISALTDAVVEQPYYQASNALEAVELLGSKNLLSLEKDDGGTLKLDSSWSKGEVAAASEYIRIVSAPRRDENESELEAKRNIRESLHYLTNSIARMLDYYKSNHKEINFDTVYLAGTSVHIKGIEEFFTSEIGIPHKKLDRLSTVSSRKKATSYRLNPSEFLYCIGAVLKPIDFIPQEFILQKQKRSVVIGTILFSMACLAGSASLIYVAYMDYQIAREELSEVTDEMNALPQLTGAHSTYETAVNELKDLEKLESMTKSNNDNIRDVIEQLEKKLPKGTVTHSMEFSEAGVVMNLTANDNSAGPNALIAKILKQVKDIDYFKDNVTVSGISVVDDNGLALVNFTLTCNYVK